MELSELQTALEQRIARHGPESVVSLIDSNFLDNGFVLPAEILQNGFAAWLGQRDYHPHPLGALSARQSIASFYNDGGPVSQRLQPARGDKASQSVTAVHADNILITASSSESYNLLFQTFCEPGDSILLPQPGYPLFEDLAAACHLETRFYPLLEARGWQPDLDMLELLPDERTRFLILISPNNPCGSVIPESTLSSIVRICEARNIMIISDEVFSEFLYEGSELPRAASFSASVPVFTINGISKLFACPDLKLSWIIVGGPDAHLMVETLALRNDSFLSCNSLSQFLLPRLFAEAGPFVRNMVADIAENRAILGELSKEFIEIGARIFVPGAGIHGIISLSTYAFGIDDESIAIHLLEKHGIYIHPGFLYGMEDQIALVFSMLKRKTIFERGMRLVAVTLKDLAGV